MQKFALIVLGAGSCLASHRRDGDTGAEQGKTPAISPIFLSQQHGAKPATGSIFTGVYSTNFNETPCCCPFSPKAFEVPNQPKGWGGTPFICQVADSGQDGAFNSKGTELLGQAYVKTNGSVAFVGSAASFNGIYTFEFASTDTKTFDNVRWCARCSLFCLPVSFKVLARWLIKILL